MAALSWSPPGMLHRPHSPLRGSFVWLLLVLLLAGAASYSHGSRYAIVPDHAPVRAGEVVHQAGPAAGAEELGKDGCERRKAPRSQPAPVRSGAVDPPALTGRQPQVGMPSLVAPPDPDLPALTVVKLSISRT